ncbi:MAG: ribosome biogenesis GTPase Der [Deltaproteobacteria bacterium]|nr:ribosome biogenesis GTPase Der [Deltaproteobacteria bacterium]
MKQNTVSKEIPLVAIIGRPNVGKSSLFNRIIGWRKAIVENIPGVTRDRNYAEAVWRGVEFRLVDTGGFEPVTDDFHLSLTKGQIRKAIEEADLIIFLLDGQTGLMPQDREILDMLRKSDKNIISVINKIDHEKHEIRAVEFHSLGIDDVITVSAAHGRKIDELLDAILEKITSFEPKRDHRNEKQEIRIAVIGKPNVGKSTLINRIIGEERFLTSPLPGTTRDSVDTILDRGGKRYILVDTAGIRRRSKITSSVERFSVLRAVKSIERTDIVLHMIDCQDGPAHQDARLAELVREKGKGCIVLLNKWDLVPRDLSRIPGVREIVREKLKATDFAPVIRVSALTGKNVNKIFERVDLVYENLYRRLATKELNNFLYKITSINPLPYYHGREVKFYYISQPMTNPPTFVIFTNSIMGVPDNYLRYLENRFRDEFQLEGVPVKFIFRARRNRHKQLSK